MSLLYIIDGYNIINHPSFTQNSSKRIKNTRLALLDLIKRRNLTGSRNNYTVVVFDGYPDSQEDADHYPQGIQVIFSKDISADEKIKSLVQKENNPRNAVVISDDKEIIYFIRSLHSRAISVEEFLGSRKKLQGDGLESRKESLNYSQIHEINQELKKLWLK